ncbi:DUF5791 family protein [Natronobiforma cellulositropha]|uniref:DUF5791 family protein n=1 Tax=Natronobiforma cellulositropha TaxID=1679076 RepID=UPI0021D5B681|nr:DUF5791 family protein [Natronobiforma cellulositropha]
MFYDQRTDAPASPQALRAAYDEQLRDLIERVGLETAADETPVDREALEALAAGETPDLSLEETAALVSLAEGEPDPETVVEMACENLLLGMTVAVLDVEAVEADLEIDLEAREVQQKIERRAPMRFEEFVHIQYVIADRTP